MSGWPNLVPVPELYRWLRNEVPGGRMLAPTLAWVGCLYLLALAGRYFWTVFLQPIAALALGGVVVAPTTWQAVTATALLVVLGGVIAYIRWEVGEIRKGLIASWAIQDAIISGLPHNLDQMRQRIADLEAHTDVSGLRALLTERLMAQTGLVCRGPVKNNVELTLLHPMWEVGGVDLPRTAKQEAELRRKEVEGDPTRRVRYEVPGP